MFNEATHCFKYDGGFAWGTFVDSIDDHKGTEIAGIRARQYVDDIVSCQRIARQDYICRGPHRFGPRIQHGEHLVCDASDDAPSFKGMLYVVLAKKRGDGIDVLCWATGKCRSRWLIPYSSRGASVEVAHDGRHETAHAAS